MAAAGSSYSKSGEEEYPYPYPSHVCAPNFVTVKLSGREMYDVWKTQMLCLLESHDMLAFIQLPSLGKENHQLWRRSDALVKGWILGSLSEQTLKYVVMNLIPKTDFTAKDAWDKLQTIYGPRVQADHNRHPEERIGREETEEEKKKRKEKESKAQQLYEATITQSFSWVEGALRGSVVTLRDKITINGNTALHVAVGTSYNKEYLEKMLNSATQGNDQQPLDMRNSEGSTLLHVAAIVGNTEAAKLLVEKHPDLLYAKDNEGQTPVARALSNMHADTYDYLWDRYYHFPDLEKGDSLFYASELMVNMISSKDYVSAHDFIVRMNRGLESDTDTVLMAIAQNFPPDLNFWESMMLPVTFKFVKAIKRKAIAYTYAKMLLNRICIFMRSETESKALQYDYYTNAILEGTRQNADKFVRIIVTHFPDAIWISNEDGHNIIQYAVINRSEKVYNLLYHMSAHKNIYRTIKDPFGNNLLHLAARLAPANKLNLISGAALQLQLELQWFKEVEKFVCPLNVVQKNSFGETPQMVFTREHKELMIEGEKWMKATAESYTITAALITTIVFAAAITVPGETIKTTGYRCLLTELPSQYLQYLTRYHCSHLLHPC